MEQVRGEVSALLPTALQDRLIEAPGLRCGGQVVVYELAPLHHHHGELVGVVTLVLVHHRADQPRIGQGTVAH